MTSYIESKSPHNIIPIDKYLLNTGLTIIIGTTICIHLKSETYTIYIQHTHGVTNQHITTSTVLLSF